MIGNSSKKGGGLLRRPRAPAPVPPPPASPPPKSYTSEVGSQLYSFPLEQPFSIDHQDHVPSIHTSIISPPPPSELHSQINLGRSSTAGSHPSRRPVSITALRKGDLKYVIDPMVREKTNLGTYVEGSNLLKPYRKRGPESFPARPPKQPLPIPASMLFDDDYDKMYEPPAFTLEDFLIDFSQLQNISLVRTRNIVYSRHNYNQLQKLIHRFLQPKQETVTHMQMRPPCKCYLSMCVGSVSFLVANCQIWQLAEWLGNWQLSIYPEN